MSDKWKPMLPGEKFKDDTIVASVIYSDDDTDGPARDEWTLLTLRPNPPFFRVVIYDRATNNVDYQRDHENIVPAVEDYKWMGGDH